MRLTLAIILLALSAMAWSGAAHARPTPFEAEAARQCPDRHLADLLAVDLGRRMQAFEARLPEAHRRAVQAAVGKRCALVEGGDTCANAAGLAVYRRLNLLKAFVAEICAR
jgi:hypothetical protein